VPPLTLAIVEGTDAGREIPVTEATLFGRDPSSDVVIAESEVSSKHASFVPMDGGLAVEDLDSTNGTFVNGQRLSGSHRLQPGDRIQIGSMVLEVRGPAAAPAPAETPAVAQPLAVTRERRIPTLPLLVFTSGQMAGTELPVAGQVVVGRDPGAADVILDQDTEISRRHATFSQSGAGLTVQDLGSTNGTFVNGRRLTGAIALETGGEAPYCIYIMKNWLLLYYESVLFHTNHFSFTSFSKSTP
jgi:pSer/pThr/pTyr-binding forkhead associated (FHA) protein